MIWQILQSIQNPLYQIQVPPIHYPTMQGLTTHTIPCLATMFHGLQHLVLRVSLIVSHPQITHSALNKQTRKHQRAHGSSNNTNNGLMKETRQSQENSPIGSKELRKMFRLKFHQYIVKIKLYFFEVNISKLVKRNVRVRIFEGEHLGASPCVFSWVPLKRGCGGTSPLTYPPPENASSYPREQVPMQNYMCNVNCFNGIAKKIHFTNCYYCMYLNFMKKNHARLEGKSLFMKEFAYRFLLRYLLCLYMIIFPTQTSKQPL